jgi:hypothetical protein
MTAVFGMEAAAAIPARTTERMNKRIMIFIVGNLC